MALYYELQVFKDVYTLVQKVFLYTQEFPREYKYTLGQDMAKGCPPYRSICLPVRRFAMAGGYVAVPAKAGRTGETGKPRQEMAALQCWIRLHGRAPTFPADCHASLAIATVL
jgi:hypothetical protein